MRDRKRGTVRDLRREITLLMGYEITRNLPITTKRVTTPLVEIDAPVIAGKKLAIVPVLRAGVGMSDGLLELIPSALVGHIAMVPTGTAMMRSCPLRPDLFEGPPGLPDSAVNARRNRNSTSVESSGVDSR